jgi:hypothetical protein
MMDWEKLTLSVQASKLGWEVVKPPFVRGESGVNHAFDFLATTSTVKYAFDVYQQITEIEVLNSYIKKVDTKSIVNLICVTGKTNDGASRLAEEYGMKVMRTAEIQAFFETLLLKKPNGTAKEARSPSEKN